MVDFEWPEKLFFFTIYTDRESTKISPAWIRISYVLEDVWNLSSAAFPSDCPKGRGMHLTINITYASLGEEF